VESNASEEPISVPVHLRVTGEPAPFDRGVWRPWLRSSCRRDRRVIGWILGGWAGAEVPAVASRLDVPAIPPALFWRWLSGWLGDLRPDPRRPAASRLARPLRHRAVSAVPGDLGGGLLAGARWNAALNLISGSRARR